jgi:hypothetical protein
VLRADPPRVQRLQQLLRQQRFYGAVGPIIQSAVARKVPPTSAPFSTSKRAPYMRLAFPTCSRWRGWPRPTTSGSRRTVRSGPYVALASCLGLQVDACAQVTK